MDEECTANADAFAPWDDRGVNTAPSSGGGKRMSRWLSRCPRGGRGLIAVGAAANGDT